MFQNATRKSELRPILSRDKLMLQTWASDDHVITTHGSHDSIELQFQVGNDRLEFKGRVLDETTVTRIEIILYFQPSKVEPASGPRLETLDWFRVVILF